MDCDKILLSIKEDLTGQGVDCVFVPIDDLLHNKLLIYTGENKKKLTQLIEIKVQTSEVNQAIADGSGHDYASFQLDAFFPLVVDDLAMSEVAQFLHFLNFQVEVPGFYLNYIDKTIVYRYVLLSESDHVPKKILLSLVGIAMFFQDVFGQTLERLATGEVTFIQMMEEIQKILEKVNTSKTNKNGKGSNDGKGKHR